MAKMRSPGSAGKSATSLGGELMGGIAQPLAGGLRGLKSLKALGPQDLFPLKNQFEEWKGLKDILKLIGIEGF